MYFNNNYKVERILLQALQLNKLKKYRIVIKLEGEYYKEVAKYS